MSWRDHQPAVESGATRAVNLTIAEDEVRAACTKRGLEISALETLISGGTRVIMVNLADADALRRHFRAKLIDGAVVRTRWVANR